MAAGSEFYVKLNGIKLPAAAEKKIAAEVRATVLRELARVDIGAPAGGSIAVRIPRDWLGLWLDRIRGGGGLPPLPTNIGPGR